MSIATIGQQRYDFQDLVCIMMMLHFNKHVGLDFRIEANGGEDAEMHFTDAQPPLHIEIQVKDRATIITLDVIAEILAHFPPHKTENSLFERLISDSRRFVVLVLSNRCNDAASIYRANLNWQGEAHPFTTINEADANNLLGALTGLPKPSAKTSTLNDKRRQYLGGVIKATDVAKVREALTRLIVIEQVNEESLIPHCEYILRTQHKIPIDLITHVISRLRTIVKAAKTDQSNVITDLRIELAKFTPSCLRPTDYIDRGNEETLVDTLSKSNVLLLSGSPRVGKSFAARRIASRFQEFGYEVRETVDVDVAERFLLEPVDAQRLVLLDDPLGGVHAVSDSSRVFSRIKTLISRLTSNRKLVIAQVQDRLFDVAQTTKLAGIVIQGNSWTDFSEHRPDFLCKLWKQLKVQHDILEPLFSTVLNALKEGELVLEPGCVQHLAVDHRRLGDSNDLGKIVRLAREDAVSLGQALSQESSAYKQILLGLAIASAPGMPITIQELAFVLGSGGEALFGVSNIIGHGIGFGGDSEFKAPPTEYNYASPPELTQQDEDVLEALERRRIIDVIEKFGLTTISFSHPFYTSAAETILNGATHWLIENVLTILKRGLFCLSTKTSRATASNISWIYDQLSKESAKSSLVSLAISGLDSSYPITRDICFAFLVKLLPQLPLDIQKKLPTWVTQVTFLSLDDAQWIGGEARWPIGDRIIIETQLFNSVKENDALDIIQNLDGTDSAYISPELAWKALCFFKGAPKKMSECAMLRLLSYEEALIRAEAILIWLSEVREGDTIVLERIFMEDHPAVGIAVLEAAVQSWFKCNEARQLKLLDCLSKFATSPLSATVMIEKLVVFGREEYTGNQTPWPIFAAVMPLVLTALPASTHINDARLFGVLDDACAVLPVETMLKIIDSWIDVLERITKIRLPSDYALGVSDILLTVTEDCPELRAGRVGRILALTGTGTLVRVIADLVTGWAKLTNLEKELIYSLLSEERIDRYWLRAAALTRKQVPHELEQRLLPQQVTLNLAALVLIEKIEPRLLAAAVKIYIGEPQPLWYIGTHHSRSSTWASVIEQIAKEPTHPLFEGAWGEITSGADGPKVAHFVEFAGAEHAPRVFELLFAQKLKTSGDFMPEAWAVLLDLAVDTNTRSDWIKRMASVANIVLDDLSNAKAWLEGENLKEFYSHFTNDDNLLKLVFKVRKVTQNTSVLTDQPTRSAFLKMVKTIFSEAPPLHYATCTIIINLMKRMNYIEDELSLIETHRLALLDSRAENSELPAAKIDSWIFN